MDEPFHLVHILEHNRWGGVEVYALDICRYFLSKGWKVSALTRDAKAVDNRFENVGVNLEHARLGGMADIGSARILAGMMKKMPSQRGVIHVHDFINAFRALTARTISGRKDIRIIVTRHIVERGKDNWLYRYIYRNIDAVVFVSHIAYDRFLSRWHGKKCPLPEEKVHIIHNSLNLDGWSGSSIEKKRPVTAMFHGPLLPGKGVETLIDALPLLKGLRMRMRIVGNGQPDYVDKIRRRAITRGVMEMIDWKKHTDNPMALIEDCDFGVLPSSAEEAFGLANIEYMACGKPQVCSSNGAQPEYITDGREGFLVTPSSSGSLADAMRKLATDADLRMRMGTRSRESFLRNLSWESFVKRLEPIYRGS